jgi:FixJ family two-component response regulator
MPQHLRTVVVVEDDAGLRAALGRVLSVAGFQARTFADAEQVLQASAARTAACLVLDVHLPLLSGFELYDRLLAESGVRPPVVFISAHDEPDARRQATSAGAAYLPKPFAGRQLLAAVERAMNA